MGKSKVESKRFKTTNETYYNRINFKIKSLIKKNRQVIIFSIFLFLTIIFAYLVIMIYFEVFFKNFTYIGLNKSFVTGTIFEIVILTSILYLFKFLLLDLKDDNKGNNDFIKVIKKFLRKITIWFFVLIFVVLTIAIIGNGLYPLIFPNLLPVPLTYKISYYVLKSGSNDNWIPEISNITCKSATNKEIYVAGDILNCNFLVNKKNLSYSFDKIVISSLANSSFYFTNNEILPAYQNGDNISFSIWLDEPKFKAGLNYINLHIDFKDNYNTSSTFYNAQYWVIELLSQGQFKDRNNKKFAYLFGLFAFSLVSGLSIVKNLKEILTKK